MTCQDSKEPVVERARGSAAGPGTAAAVDSHLEHCAQCAALFERERALSQELRALADSARGEEGSATLADRVMAGFAARHAAPPVARGPGMLTGGRGWLAAAAAILVVGGAAAWGVVSQPGERTFPVPGGSHRVVPGGTNAAGGELDPMEGFIVLPAAVGLPAFESGQIVRIDVPVASLPAYGVPLIPDAATREIEADVLIGQDGQPRAIRLVSGDEGSEQE